MTLSDSMKDAAQQIHKPLVFDKYGNIVQGILWLPPFLNSFVTKTKRRRRP